MYNIHKSIYILHTGGIVINIIINADDFGLTKAVNFGIIEAFQNGIVTSTSIMAGMPAFNHAVNLWKQNTDLKIGVHLTLTAGKPVGSGYKTIVDDDGFFFKQNKLRPIINGLDNGIDIKEVENEFTKQIEKVLEAGIKITHIDGHHHIHAVGVLQDLIMSLCKKYNVATRCITDEHIDIFKANKTRTTDSFSNKFYGKDINVQDLINIIENCKKSSLEVMCHPGYVDKELYSISDYNIPRIFEVDILTSNTIKAYIKENHITLCGYDSINI